MSEWISVEKAIPDDGKKVLCLTRNGYVVVGCHVRWIFRRFLKCQFCSFMDEWRMIEIEKIGQKMEYVAAIGLKGLFMVTHWQPLPEPPKEN